MRTIELKSILDRSFEYANYTNKHGLTQVKSKYCPNCNMTMSFEFFNFNKNSKDGLYHICKNCQSERHTQYNLQKKEQSMSKMEFEKIIEEQIELEPEIYNVVTNDKILEKLEKLETILFGIYAKIGA